MRNRAQDCANARKLRDISEDLAALTLSALVLTTAATLVLVVLWAF
ncbi:MAG: hypothetical protein ACE5HB_10575 [Terriglobia bacterium]